MLEGGQAKIAERLNDPPTWQKIKKEMAALLAERGLSDLSFAIVAMYRADPSLNGLSMKQVASRRMGSDSADAQFEAARDHDARRRRVDGLSLHERRRRRSDHAASARRRSRRTPAC